jgi:hypothetical protein
LRHVTRMSFKFQNVHFNICQHISQHNSRIIDANHIIGWINIDFCWVSPQCLILSPSTLPTFTRPWTALPLCTLSWLQDGYPLVI